MSAKKTGSTDPDILSSKAAMQRAAKKALQIGVQTGTAVWVIKDGRMVDLTKKHKKRGEK